ncbi:hypothetical protein Q5P01_013320 [Channa striata]|uniref:Syntaxin-binding protein 5-like n=1 Tax=Channa striata TaxID=64152 RepID=A0AA88SN64_CHASR|nr:hypothetical protein Q5P01_013320 [Channa striata]
MKKFRKVLDGLTTSSPGGTVGSPACGSAAGTPTAAPTPKEIDVQETLVSENFQLCKTVRHGFPYQPTALAFDPVQKILAIGSRSGGVRMLRTVHPTAPSPGSPSHRDGRVRVSAT